MRTAASSGDSSNRRGARIQHERAEILRLITQLTARRVTSAEQDRRRRARATMPAPPGEVESRTPRRRTSIPRAAVPNLDSSLVTLLQAMEARLLRLEERLSKRRSSRPSPPKSEAPEPEHADATFSGVIQGQMLSDMLQLVSSNDLNGVFVVEHSGTQCKLYFQLGRICHAEAGVLKGEEAFFAAFGADSGRYWFTETDEPPPEKTIDSATQFLILEALRRIDESNAE